jgi:hypothetical protein
VDLFHAHRGPIWLRHHRSGQPLSAGGQLGGACFPSTMAWPRRRAAAAALVRGAHRQGAHPCAQPDGGGGGIWRLSGGARSGLAATGRGGIGLLGLDPGHALCHPRLQPAAGQAGRIDGAVQRLCRGAAIAGGHGDALRHERLLPASRCGRWALPPPR